MDNFNGKSPLYQFGNSRRLHVVMFPWLARGHISPFIQLCKRLAQKSINISFVSTPLNIADIKSSFGEEYDGAVNLVELALPPLDGMPSGVECTAHLPSHLIMLFHIAARGLEKDLEKLLAQIKPDFVIFDHILYWTSKVALRLHIPSILFTTYSAAFVGYDFCPARMSAQLTADNLCYPPPGYPSSIRRRPYETKSIVDGYTAKIELESDVKGIDCLIDCYSECSAIVIKSCRELEGKFIDYLHQVTMRPVLPVGPLLPRPYHVKKIEGLGDEEKVDCLRWLEKQRACSVVYASFGSEYFLSKEEIEEIALGLEASQQPFLWAVRFPCAESLEEKKKVLDFLPEGFEGRIAERGLVLSGWAPQVEILCHPSTGAFLTHCGWSSVMEGMAAGLPLIALPMQLDQGLNARLVVEELKVCVEVERGSDGCFRRGDVCNAVRIALVEEEGKSVRDKAAGMRDLFRNEIVGDDEESFGSEMQYIDGLVRLLHG